MLCVLPAGLQPPSATLMFFIRLLSWLHCAFLAASSLTDCFPPCFLHLGYHWSLCLAQLTPAYGVTSMPIHPGCHRPFTRSVVRRSVADACRGLALCFLFLISAFYFHVRHPRSSLLQHVITPSVFTLRPFALYLSSWRVLVAYAFRTSLGIKLRPVFIIDCGRWRTRTSSSSQALRRITAALVGCRSIYFGRCARLFSLFQVAGLLHRFRLFPSLYRGTYLLG